MNRFLTPSARCPKCDRVPNVRFNDTERGRYREVDPDHIVQTVQCRCGTVYPVKARDILEAA